MVEVPVEQSISSTSEEEELKSNDTTSVVALSLIRTAESTSYVVSLLFRTLILLPVFERDIGLTLLDTLL